MTTTANQDIRELRQEVKNLAAMVQDNIKDASDAASNILGFDRKQLKRMARNAGKEVRHFFTDTTKQANEMRDRAEETITSRPFASVAAAVAGGLVLGALLRRK